MVAYPNLESARIAFLAVATTIKQAEASAILLMPGLPHCLIKTAESSMQMVRAGIFLQLIFSSVSRKTAAGNAVAATSNQAAEVGVGLKIPFEPIEAEDHIAQSSVAILNL